MHGNDSRVTIWSCWMKELGTYLHIHGVSHSGLILSSDLGGRPGHFYQMERDAIMQHLIRM